MSDLRNFFVCQATSHIKQPLLGDLHRVVERGAVPVVPHVHVLALPEHGALQTPLGRLVVPIPGCLQQPAGS